MDVLDLCSDDVDFLEKELEEEPRMGIVCKNCGSVTKVKDIQHHNGGLVECVKCGGILFASCPRCDWAKIGDEEFSIRKGYVVHVGKKHPELVERKKKIVRSWRKKGMSYSELSERFNRSENTIRKWIREAEENE